MLSKFLFNDFFSEYNLKTIENKDLFLAALLSFKRLNTTQIHKLSFLTFAEEKTIIPFEFIKMPYGPFSKDMDGLLKDFCNRGLVVMEEKVYDNWKEDTWTLSESGQMLISSNKEKVEEIRKKLDKVVEMYGVNATALGRYCYINYLLKSVNEKPQDYEARIKTNIDNLRIILTNRTRDLGNIEDINEPCRAAILACFDYINNLLEVLFSNINIDPVIRGVLIKKSESYINIWGEIIRLSNEEGVEPKIKTLLKDSKELFNFINISSEKYGVFESVF
ncbi:MAG: hypothetical protein KKE50_01080 [Nanoarchaeota archaeon]|nr:hypothetical protein [Nanoarchaeota archaeon]